jgi:hypothetical protein
LWDSYSSSAEEFKGAKEIRGKRPPSVRPVAQSRGRNRVGEKVVRTVRLGIRENLAQFLFLLAVSVLVGGTVGQERAIVPSSWTTATARS